ncbi:3170_t:CDS:2 [Diversispora eburnea]|uniref:3170_t:CDS:1 n=1 Tax=Diversispora eburnea TaxID=1213867 RepID=A0A9N9BA83_9GLOM|nr:3170_t:CDS:2 [Diversispora eburnea]
MKLFTTEDEEELDALFKNVEESYKLVQQEKQIQSDKKKSKSALKFPKLFHIDDEQLYIKTNPDGIAVLKEDAVPIIGFEKKENNNNNFTPEGSNKLVQSSQHLQQTKLSKKEKQKLRESTSGPGWFDMPKPELTPEIKRDLHVIKLRNVLDPKRFYKKDNSKNIPKYFQVGTIIEGPTDFYASRLPRKERKKTIVDELMADDKAKKYYKRKFLEIQETKQSGGKKYYKNLRNKRIPEWKR